MNASEETTVSDVPSIADEVSRFVEYINSLAETINPMMFMIQSIRKRHSKKIEVFERKHCEVELIEGGRKVRIPHDRMRQYEKLISQVQRYALADKLIPRSIIISLISQFDTFVGNLVRVLSQLHPQSLNIEEKSITFSQLQSFGTIENAREYLIEKEIDALLRGSHDDMFDWLEKKYNLPLRKDLKIWPIFIEATERRNLFVHTSGTVSEQYLNVCKQHKVNIAENIEVGSELQVTPEYFQLVYECIFQMGVGLAHVLWRKILPGDREQADINLNDICYDLLVEEKFGLACALLDFATAVPKKYSDEYHRLMFIVNHAQAYKWANDIETAKRIIASEDWSATQAAFRLAVAVILDNFDEANNIVREIGKEGKVTKLDYREWPLFRGYRKSEDFIKTFEEVFEEPFHLAQVERVNTADFVDNSLLTSDKTQVDDSFIEIDIV